MSGHVYQFRQRRVSMMHDDMLAIRCVAVAGGMRLPCALAVLSLRAYHVSGA